MGTLLHLSTLALRPLIDGAVRVVGLPVGEGAVNAVAGFLQQRFTDQSQRLTRALNHSSDRAWRSLELALAGESWWGSVRLALAPADEKAIRQQVLTFLRAAPLPDRSEKHFREKCLRDLQKARKGWLQSDGELRLEDLAREAGSFARFGNPQAILDAETERVLRLSAEVRQRGHDSLAWLLEQRPAAGPPLLVVAVRYFFRRAVETDQQLFQGLLHAQMGDSLERMRRLDQSMTDGLAGLDEALARHSGQVEQLLADLGASVDRLLELAEKTHSRVEETHGVALATNEAVQQLQDQVRLLTDLLGVSNPGGPAARLQSAPAQERAAQLEREIHARMKARDAAGTIPFVKELCELQPWRDDAQDLHRKLLEWQAAPKRPANALPEQPVELRRPVEPFSRVTVCRGERGTVAVEARLLRAPAIAGARAGLALDASESMMKSYGIAGKKVIGRPAPQAVNLVEPEVRKMAAYLTRFASDREVSLIYWACGLLGHPPEQQIEEIGRLGETAARGVAVPGPRQRSWGKETNLLPPLAHFVDQVFRDAPWAICVFLTDGKIDDLEKVKKYSRRFAEDIAAGRRSFIKLVLVGVGPEVDERQMIELDDMFEGSGLKDPAGHDIDLWDHKIAAEMRNLDEIFDEVVAKNVTVARTGRVLGPAGRVIRDYPAGLPALLQFELPAEARSFTLEYTDAGGGRKASQDLSEVFTRS